MTILSLPVSRRCGHFFANGRKFVGIAAKINRRPGRFWLVFRVEKLLMLRLVMCIRKFFIELFFLDEGHLCFDTKSRFQLIVIVERMINHWNFQMACYETIKSKAANFNFHPRVYNFPRHSPRLAKRKIERHNRIPEFRRVNHAGNLTAAIKKAFEKENDARGIVTTAYWDSGSEVTVTKLSFAFLVKASTSRKKVPMFVHVAARHEVANDV